MRRLIIPLYRRLFCRKGYGIHSPFVFDLITNVLEESRGYYAYTRLHAAHALADPHDRLPLRDARWLFRLANRFHPRRLIIVGTGGGLTPLSLTAYVSSGLHAIALEECPTTADTVRTLLHDRTTLPIEVRCGSYETELPKSLSEYGRADCIVLDVSPDRLASLFDRCAGHLSEETMLLIRSIHATPLARNTWQAICAHPSATVCVDAYTWGIVFFRSGLPRQVFRHIVV